MKTTPSAPKSTTALLRSLGLKSDNPGLYAGRWIQGGGAWIESRNPATGEVIARVRGATRAQYEQVSTAAHEAYLRWRELPAPKRGELVRQIGNRLRERKQELGALVALEVGKILQEGLGEVQEAIDIADFALGQSRMLYGLSMHSERPGHSMKEQWHPLGAIGVVTAFNFPVAVWAWNSMLAWVCGDACVWKPSEHAPLCAIASTRIAAEVLEPAGFGALASLCIGSVSEVAEPLVADARMPLVSFTGSSAVGAQVGARVAQRFGRSLLELGGNNAIVLMDDADLELALPAILFGAVGTAGQRCTTTRRLLVHAKIASEVERRLVKAYAGIRIGDPLAPRTLCGPLISPQAVAVMQAALADARAEGGKLLCGGEVLRMKGKLAGGNWVRPAIVRAKNEFRAVQRETFAPILYTIAFESLDEAIELHNGVPQGLSSAIFTLDLRQAERFLSATGSDCGIANVNIGTSGAEIGGAFGGEKQTGGGRESGSDAWKIYMRRQTNTINWSRSLPLAQGIRFDL